MYSLVSGVPGSVKCKCRLPRMNEDDWLLRPKIPPHLRGSVRVKSEKRIPVPYLHKNSENLVIICLDIMFLYRRFFRPVHHFNVYLYSISPAC